MVIEANSRCVKMVLPNHKVVDILTPVFEEIYKWLQDDIEKPESGGFIVGYQHLKTGNVSLESVSHPYSLDWKNRIRFDIKDPCHKAFLKKESRRKSYYMGVWHTHPQTTPVPSSIDWDDWHATLRLDKTACQYIFFIIVGTKEIRVWVGDFKTCEICELFEVDKNEEGIYCEQTEEQEEKLSCHIQKDYGFFQ